MKAPILCFIFAVFSSFACGTVTAKKQSVTQKAGVRKVVVSTEVLVDGQWTDISCSLTEDQGSTWQEAALSQLLDEAKTQELHVALHFKKAQPYKTYEVFEADGTSWLLFQDDSALRYRGSLAAEEPASLAIERLHPFFTQQGCFREAKDKDGI